MLFLLRSAVWLGIVFSAMPWTGEESPGSRPLDVARTLAQSTARTAGEICTATPAECLAAAQKLHSLFEKVAAENPDHASGGMLSAIDRLPDWRGPRPPAR